MKEASKITAGAAVATLISLILGFTIMMSVISHTVPLALNASAEVAKDSNSDVPLVPAFYGRAGIILMLIMITILYSLIAFIRYKEQR